MSIICMGIGPLRIHPKIISSQSHLFLSKSQIHLVRCCWQWCLTIRSLLQPRKPLYSPLASVRLLSLNPKIIFLFRVLRFPSFVTFCSDADFVSLKCMMSKTQILKLLLEWDPCCEFGIFYPLFSCLILFGCLWGTGCPL